MADRRSEGRGERPRAGGGRGYGRDLGGAYGQGFAGRGYGAGVGSGDDRDYERGFGGRGEYLGGEDRSWMDEGSGAHGVAVGPYGGRGPQGWKRSDERLREQVSERLMEDRLLDARGVIVEVREGVVILRGEVPGPADITLAEMLAHQTPGVAEVRNELEHHKPAHPDDRPPFGSKTSAEATTLGEGARDEEGRVEGPRHFPKLST